jgi:hypothetical protein
MSTTISFAKGILAGLGAAAALMTFTPSVHAGPGAALAACKTEIAGDAQLSGFDSVRQNTDDIKRRGRFTNFEIKVRAQAPDGSEARWVANCKARNSGKVEALQLVQVGGDTSALVAQSDN